MSYKVKQVIVVRKDLNMRKGKMCTQVAHASKKFLVDLIKETEDKNLPIRHFLNKEQEEWLFKGQFAKIVVSVDSEQELLDLIQVARDNNVLVKEIVDLGYTEFGGVPTLTCAAFGPDLRERLDKFTGKLKLL